MTVTVSRALLLFVSETTPINNSTLPHTDLKISWQISNQWSVGLQIEYVIILQI